MGRRRARTEKKRFVIRRACPGFCGGAFRCMGQEKRSASHSANRKPADRNFGTGIAFLCAMVYNKACIHTGENRLSRQVQGSCVLTAQTAACRGEE